MKIVDAEATESALPFATLIPALREMFVGGCVVPPRHHHRIELDSAADATLLLMPAWKAHDALGVKILNVFPGNAGKGLPGLYSIYCLFDAERGTPVALLDGNVLTARRTAAVSALAASYLAPPDADWLLVVGAGRIASLLPQAYREVRTIRRVSVWNPTPAAAQALVARLRTLDFDASIAPDLEAAVRSADIVSCATLATEPLVQGDWLHPGIHLDLIGSFTPEMREADDAAIRRSTVFVDTETALAESGDLLFPQQSGAFTAGRLAATLSDLCAGRHPGRRAAQELTLFKAVGTAMSDLAAAIVVRDRLGLRTRRDGDHSTDRPNPP